MNISLERLRYIENKALKSILEYTDDYCSKNSIVIPTSNNKGFETLRLIDEIKALSQNN